MSTIKWMREHILILSATILVVSIVGLVVSVPYFFFKDSIPDSVRALINAPGNWNYWILLAASMGAIIGGWYFYDAKKKIKKFESLMDTNSKSKFTKNMADLEDIAWYLGGNHQKRLDEKKKQLRIK